MNASLNPKLQGRAIDLDRKLNFREEERRKNYHLSSSARRNSYAKSGEWTLTTFRIVAQRRVWSNLPKEGLHKLLGCKVNVDTALQKKEVPTKPKLIPKEWHFFPLLVTGFCKKIENKKNPKTWPQPRIQFWLPQKKLLSSRAVRHWHFWLSIIWLDLVTIEGGTDRSRKYSLYSPLNRQGSRLSRAIFQK